MKRSFSLLVIFFFAYFQVIAQQPILRNFSLAESKSGTQNWCVDQLPDGRMLFANNNGLLCYDGSTWSLARVPNHSIVRSVFYDDNTHRIYVGASSELGYFQRDSKTYQLLYHSFLPLLPKRLRDFNEVWKIFRLDNDIVFQSKKQLMLYNSKTNKMRVVVSSQHIESAGVINGRLYVASLQGVYYLYNGRFVNLPGTEILKNQLVKAILPMGDDILFATIDNGFYRYDGRTLQPYLLDITPFLKTNKIFCAAVKDSQFVVGTIRQGVVIKNLKTGVTSYSNILSGLQNNTVLSIGFDQLGNVWLGLDNGISYIMQNAPYAYLLGKNHDIGTAYSSLVFGSHLYLGTNQGLFVMNYPLSGQGIPVPVQNISGQVWSLYHIGNTVFCGADKGSFTVEGSIGSQISGPIGTWNFRELPAHPGYVLANDYDGFFILQKQGASYVMRNRIQGLNIATGNFEIDRDGSIWFSHWEKGIYHVWLSNDLRRVVKMQLFNADNDLIVNENNTVNKVGERIYFSSVDGFYLYNPRTKRLQKDSVLTKKVGHYGTAVRMLPTPAKDVWFFTSDFLALARHNGHGGWTLDSMSYNGIKSQLLTGLGMNNCLDSTHTLLNGKDGFYYVSNNEKAFKHRYPLIIRQIVATGKDSILYAESPGMKTATVRIPHSLNSIKIQFVMPEYRGSQAVTYQCFLEKYDSHWGNPQYLNQKEYTQLGKGNYVFHVRARNLIDGIVTEKTVKIKILPAWYETWFAYLVYIVLLFLAFRAIMKLMTRRANKELQRVKKEKELQLKEQEATFAAEKEKKEKEVVKLRNQQLEMELKHKASEIADSTMNLVRKNDMLQAIDDSMEDLSEGIRREDSKASLTKKISDIRKEIYLHQNDDENWDKFEQNFNLVYDNFMAKLTARYPNLKLNDIKLCAYLKMGLSSKEIASLLNTAVRSVETARYRLRKKLNLNSGENLSDFIQKLE